MPHQHTHPSARVEERPEQFVTRTTTQVSAWRHAAAWLGLGRHSVETLRSYLLGRCRGLGLMPLGDNAEGQSAATKEM